MIVRSSGSPCAMTCLLSLGESQDRQDRLVRRGRHLAAQLVGSRDEASEHGDEPGPTFRPERQVGLRAEALDGFLRDGIGAFHGVSPFRRYGRPSTPRELVMTRGPMMASGLSSSVS